MIPILASSIIIKENHENLPISKEPSESHKPRKASISALHKSINPRIWKKIDRESMMIRRQRENKEKGIGTAASRCPPLFRMLRYCATATPHRESFRQSGLGRRQRQYDGARAHRLGSEAPSFLAVPVKASGPVSVCLCRVLGPVSGWTRCPATELTRFTARAPGLRAKWGERTRQALLFRVDIGIVGEELSRLIEGLGSSNSGVLLFCRYFGLQAGFIARCRSSSVEDRCVVTGTLEERRNRSSLLDQTQPQSKKRCSPLETGRKVVAYKASWCKESYESQVQPALDVLTLSGARVPSKLDEDLDDLEDEKGPEQRAEEEDFAKEGGTQHRLSPRLHDIEEEDDEDGRNTKERSLDDSIDSLEVGCQFIGSLSATSGTAVASSVVKLDRGSSGRELVEKLTNPIPCRPYQKKSPTPSGGGGSRTGWRSRRSITTAGAPAHQHHVIASAAATAQARMQAEQGSIGELRGYHNLRSRRHTLANVR
ncbi:hypothetical protein WN48_01997 [Eufriesea mexicana]|nr:hypothetical protein WN48_01997 [Eufriesea mexicana]